MHLEFIPTHTTSTHPLQVSSPHKQILSKMFCYTIMLIILLCVIVLIHNEIGKGSTITLPP